MPYTMKVEGMEEISEMLTKLEGDAEAVAALGLYDGAGIMADTIKSSAGSIREAPFKWASTRRGETRLPSPEEKEIVMNAEAGIAKFDKNGSEVDTSVGYRNAGYAVLKNKTVPVPVIVNAINSGTSFMRKQPFFRKAVSKGSKAAEAAITAKIEEVLGNITKEK